jgi:hypothetical protein
MTTRRAILGLAVALNLILLSLALPVNHGSALPSQASPQLVADGIPLPPPVPPPPKNGEFGKVRSHPC